MAENVNGITAKLDAVIASSETPEWGKVVLLLWRDDHKTLCDHLAAHRRWSAPFTQIAVSVATALVITLFVWILAGRFPATFGP